MALEQASLPTALPSGSIPSPRVMCIRLISPRAEDAKSLSPVGSPDQLHALLEHPFYSLVGPSTLFPLSFPSLPPESDCPKFVFFLVGGSGEKPPPPSELRAFSVVPVNK